MTELFPYMSKSKIQRALAKLEKEGLILKGNYNAVKYDRTLWYTLSPDGYSLFNMGYGKPNMGFPCSQNRSPIPDINTVINTDNIKTTTPKESGFDFVIDKGSGSGQYEECKEFGMQLHLIVAKVAKNRREDIPDTNVINTTSLLENL